MMRLSIPSWLPLPAHMQTHMTAAHAGQVLRAILLIQTELCCQLLVNLLSAEYFLVFFSHTWTFKNYQFLNYLYLAKVTCAVPYHLIEKHWWWDAGWGIHQVAVTFSKWLFLRNDTSYSLGDCLSVPISFFFAAGWGFVSVFSCSVYSACLNPAPSCLPVWTQRSLSLMPSIL